MRKSILLLLITAATNSLFSQTVAVSASKTNVFYQWLENPVTIVVENCPCKNIIVKTDTGKLEGRGCDYTFTAGNGINMATLTIGIKGDKKPKWLYSTTIRVKPLPNPVVTISNNRGGPGSIISKNALLASPFVSAPVNLVGLEFGDEPEIQRVLTYSVKITRRDSIIYQQKNVPGGEMPKDVWNFIWFICNAGDKIQLQDIVVLMYKKEKRNVDDLEVTLSE